MGSPYGRRAVAVRFGEPLARVCLSSADVAEAGPNAPEGLGDDVASFGPRPVVNRSGLEFGVVPFATGNGVDAKVDAVGVDTSGAIVDLAPMQSCLGCKPRGTRQFLSEVCNGKISTTMIVHSRDTS